MLTMEQIDSEIQRLSTLLEDATYEYRAAAQDAAEAEAEYRREKAIATIASIEHGGKMTAPEREARAHRHVADQHKSYLLNSANRDGIREFLVSTRTRLEVLRTLAANVRYQTSH